MMMRVCVCTRVRANKCCCCCYFTLDGHIVNQIGICLTVLPSLNKDIILSYLMYYEHVLLVSNALCLNTYFPDFSFGCLEIVITTPRLQSAITPPS